MTDLIERLERAVEIIDRRVGTRGLSDLCDEAVLEILRLRNRVWELEDKLHAARVGACEVSDDRTARIRELERQLADRDAAWERAVRLAVLHLILFGTGAECDEDENTLAAIEKKVEDFMGLLNFARNQAKEVGRD